jgi:rhodanese-related sulfurtransferase
MAGGISPEALKSLLEGNSQFALIDVREPGEYNSAHIPGSSLVPRRQLEFDLPHAVPFKGAQVVVCDDDRRRARLAAQTLERMGYTQVSVLEGGVNRWTTVVVNCAGRTRSIIGTHVLQRMGLNNVYGLRNGTSGWVLAGYELESGADRVGLPEVSPEGRAAAEAYAAKLAQEDGVRYLDIPTLQEVMTTRDRETVYLIDVRTREEYEQGHIPGFRWFPGGQAVQRSDDVAVVHNAAIVFACDGKARATFTASWYRQMGLKEVYAVDGGVTAWAGAGLGLEKGIAEPEPFGLAEARKKAQLVSPQELQSSKPPLVIFVDTSQDFARGHVPGSRWAPRGWLEFQIGDLAPSQDTPIAVTCADGRNSALAGATLKDLGYQNVSVLEGGMAAWQQAGLPMEEGLSGVMRPPTDLVFSGPDRTYADMMNYLRWEETLGHKYESA